MPDTTNHPPAIGDNVALTSRLLFDDDVRRDGVVTAVADDGKITAEFPQPPYSPMLVTSDAEHFTVVRRAPEPVGYVVLKHTPTGALSIVGGVFGSVETAEAARPLFERDGFEGDVFTVCRLVPEAGVLA
jgi:hypothetical protein